MPLNSKNIYSLRYVIQTFYPATYFLIFYELTIKNKPVCDDKLEMEKEVLGIKEGHHTARKIERVFYANDIH